MSRLSEPIVKLTTDWLNILNENHGESPIRKLFRNCGAAHGLSTVNAAGPGSRSDQCPGAERGFACLNAEILIG